MNIRKDIPWITHNSHFVYFDNAATTLKPKKVLDAIMKYYVEYGTNTHNPDSPFSYRTLIEIDNAREIISTLFMCHKENIIFNSGATEGLSMIALGLKKYLKTDDEILLNDQEHSSNIVPWLNLKNDIDVNIKFVKKNDIINDSDIIKNVTQKTKVVSFATTTNLLGSNINYINLCKKIKAINKDIIVVIDATQSIPHEKLNTKDVSIDFAVCSAHKMLGPTGIGCVYISSKWLDKIDPIRFGGGMNSYLGYDGFSFATGPDKFEGGTINAAGIFGWKEAVLYLDNIGWEKIKPYELELKTYFIKKLKELNQVVVYNENTETSIVLFNYKNVFSQDFANYLGQNNIIVRSGLSCAKLAKNTINNDSAIRASLYIYNTKEEIDYFIKVIKKYKIGDELKNLA